MSTDPTAAGCTDPCIACMTGESHDPAPTPTETDEQRTDRITLNRDQLAALLAHHADVIAAHLRTDPARDRWIAAEQIDAHALALTAGEETSVVRELLDSILAFEAEQHAPPSVPADADLRDRIRRACAEADGFRLEGLEPWDYQTHADKLLAVIPPSAYRRLLARLEADRAGHLRATVRAKEAGADEVLVAVGGTFASAFRFAAAMAVRAFEGPDAAEAYMQRTEGGEGPPFDVEAGLQRLADDLQRGETAASRATLVEGPQTVTHNANESTARPDSATACGQNLRYESPPVDRAAVLREAADDLAEDDFLLAAEELRRMADEAQQAVECSSSPEVMGPEFKDAAGTLNSSAAERADGVLDERVVAVKEQQVEAGEADPSLRDRLRQAFCEASGFDWDPDSWEPDEYGEQADAALAIFREEAAR